MLAQRLGTGVCDDKDETRDDADAGRVAPQRHRAVPDAAAEFMPGGVRVRRDLTRVERTPVRIGYEGRMVRKEHRRVEATEMGDLRQPAVIGGLGGLLAVALRAIRAIRAGFTPSAALLAECALLQNHTLYRGETPFLEGDHNGHWVHSSLLLVYAPQEGWSLMSDGFLRLGTPRSFDELPAGRK